MIVGGGNTFQLLKRVVSAGCWRHLDVVKRGALYIGWSAGNLACQTIRTTNDMPIVDPKVLMCWVCSRCRLTHISPTRCRKADKGETREQRIRELLVVAPELTVIGLPEGNWIRVSKGKLRSAARHHPIQAVKRRLLLKQADCF
ncbi:Type 1 glutamine amidotransferase-like domain-containing protein [Shigella flexneri]